MTARVALIVVSWLLIAIAVHRMLTPEPAGEPERHAVVLVTIDTARADHFDWDDAERLPAIKRFFSEGTRFDQAVAVAPVTGPSHASILTGLMPLEHRLLSNPLPLRPDVETLAERLRPLGFHTAAFVSCSVLAKGRGFEQGYDHYDSEFDSAYLANYYERGAHHTTERVLTWLRENDATPFHLWVHYFDPHAPYDPRGAHRTREFPHLEAREELRPTIERLHAWHEAGAVPDEVRAWYRALYAGELASIDAELGRLLAYLEGRPYRDQILVILTADHGEELGDHDSYFEHAASLYDGVMRVPLVLRARDIPASRVALQVSHASVTASVLDWLGEPVPAGLAPPLGQPQPAAALLLKEPHPFMRPWGAALRDPPWKYLYWEDGREKLFDLSRDPEETHDRAGENAALRATLHRRMLDEIVPALGSRAAPGLDAESAEMLHALGYARESSSAPPPPVPAVR